MKGGSSALDSDWTATGFVASALIGRDGFDAHDIVTGRYAGWHCEARCLEDNVVDAGGRVHGLSGLRVIDAPIMPRITTGNLNAPVIMLAEKLADDICARTAL